MKITGYDSIAEWAEGAEWKFRGALALGCLNSIMVFVILVLVIVWKAAAK